MTEGVAVFVYADWAVRFPELAGGVSEPLADQLFIDAEIILNNFPWSRVLSVDERTRLLWLIVAHLAALYARAGAGDGGAGGGGGVGRISSASEGSVSVGYDYAGANANNAFWVQTGYGALYWQMTAKYRTMHYVPGRQPNFGPGWPYPMGLGYRPW